jgi:class 3 adenylate cyclase/tetratricopeptide (TPR) repeat protein
VSAFGPYLPRLVVDWAKTPERPWEELEGTLVSLDVSGFTRLSERLQAKGRAGAEELVLLLSGVYAGLIGVAERHGGDVLKFRGDALLILFSGDGHERRACQASSHMHWLIDETGRTMSSVGSVTLRMSTGIYTGRCHFFMVEGSHRELVVTGPAATATIRLESAANAGQILVSDRTAEALEPAWLGTAREGGRLLRRIDDDAGVDDVIAHFAATVPAEDDLELYIPAPLRAHLLLESGEAEHRHVTAAFVKFSGIDDLLAREGADGVHGALRGVARTIAATTSDFGLTWLESDIDVDGGKLYLVGGAPSSTGADEERMLRALRVIADSDSPLVLRAGVNRGPAFCGDVGALNRRTYAVMGDTVNLAARLVGRAEAGGILATAAVLDRSRTRFETAPQPFLVKGKERPITAYRVGAATSIREEEPQAELPLEGREAELAAFALAIGAARVRQQQLVEIAGEPGIGKSRLVEELRRQALGFTQLDGRCDQYSSSSPYAVFGALLRPLAGLTPEMSPEEAGAHLTPWIAAVMPDLAPLLPLLAIPFGAEVPPSPETEEIDPQFRRERLHEAVEKFLTRVLMMPTLVTIEDAHWIDDASHDLVAHLTRAAQPRPWLVCVTRRPQGESFVRPEVDGHFELPLGPLGPEALERLALAAAGDVALAQEALAALTERSGGNPLFLRELIAASRGAGDVAELPDSVETVILSRIDTLSPEDRFLLRNASVVGTRFELDLLAEVLASVLPDVDDLGRWERLAEFVGWEGSGALRFHHDLFRAVAYEGLSFRRRREVHARLARALELRGADPSLLSLHFLYAQEHEDAWRYSVEAARDAQHRYANADAAELYTRALEAAADLELPAEEVVPIAENLGDVAELAARYAQAEAAYTRARKLAPAAGAQQPRLLWKEGVLRERRGKYSEALRWYGRGLKALDGDESGQALELRTELELAYAGVKHRQGRFADAIDWAGRAAEHAQAAGLRSQLAHAYQLLQIAHTRLGSKDRSYRAKALPIYEELGDLIGQARVLNDLGVEAYFEGRWDEASAFYRRCRDVSERGGDVVVAATARNNEAEILSDQGRLDDARVLLEEALRVWRAAGYRVGIALATSNLARLAARGGSFDEAHRLFDDALAQFEELGADAFVGETRARVAECLVLEGRHKEATSLVGSLLENGAATQRAVLERLAGYAVVQSRAPFAKAKPHFDASAEAARAADAPYELALTLRAIAETGGDDGAEAAAILERLGVVSTPSVPLP